MNTEIEKIYGLTPLQEGMLFHKQVDENATSYVIQMVFNLCEPLNMEKIRSSLDVLARKYEVLRTFFVAPNNTDKPLQVVMKKRKIELNEIIVKNIEEKAQFEKSDISRGFDLSNDSLLRLTVLRVGDDRHSLVWTVHHIIMDGWCISLLFRDFMKYYMLMSIGTDSFQLEKLAEEEICTLLPYSEYIKWLEKQNKDEALEYWDRLLLDYESVITIPPLGVTGCEEEGPLREELALSEEATKAIEKLATQLDISLNTVLEAAWGLLLQKYNGCDDVVFGKVVSGRSANLPGIEQAVGLYINTVPARVTSRNGETVSELLREIQAQTIESIKYEYSSLTEVQSRSRIGSNLIKTLYVFRNYYVDESVYNEISEFGIELESMREEVNYSISFSAIMQDTLRLSVMYNPCEYGSYEMKLLLERMSILLKEMAAKPDAMMSELEMINENEREKIQSEFNNTSVDYPRDKTVIDLFEEQSAKTPNNVALKFEDKTLTYAELNTKSNRLAYRLRKLGIKPDSLVALITEPSIEMIVGILGTIKAGGAYVPIGSEYPEDRIKYMLKDSSAKVVLTSGINKLTCCYDEIAGNSRSDQNGKKGVSVLDLSCENSYSRKTENLSGVNKPTDLMYVIYTSGTTGTPKGVKIEHLGVMNLISNLTHPVYKEHDIKNVMLVRAYEFDASVHSIFGSLTYGSSLHIINNFIRIDFDEMYKYLCHNNVDFINCTPHHLRGLAAYNIEDSLKVLFVGGEKLETQLANSVKNIEIYNVYGPTEASVVSSALSIKNLRGKEVTIGQPIGNTQIYIMSGNKLCGVGVTGELCIAGDGLARGYLNQPMLTAEMFINNPFGEGRLYRSGDLARWQPDGNIEYLGRIDEQIKIRGFRIEPGEIENVLRKQPDVLDAVVIAREVRGDRSLCAYLIAKETRELDILKIRDELMKKLPEYMIPAFMMQLKTLPLNRNGKLDRKALPEPNALPGRIYVAPKNYMEQTVITAFEKILGVSPIGTSDSFFELGGHSLKATAAVNLIEETTGLRIPLKVIFTSPTPSMLAKELKLLGKGEYLAIPKAEKKEYYPMSSAQKRLFIIEQINGKSCSYNMSAALEVTGKLEFIKVQKALDKLIKRHEALRTSFALISGEPVQIISDEVSCEVDYEEVEAYSEEIMVKFIRPFDLGKAPLIRLKIIKVEGASGLTSDDREYRYILLFDMHHIISDGMTINIITRDFSKFYNGEELKPLGVHYKDYNEWVRVRDIESQRGYWKKVFEDEVPILDLATDFQRPKIQSLKGSQVSALLSRKQKSGIEKINKKNGTTDYMTLLAIFMVELHKYSRQEDIVVGMPISTRLHKDTEDMAGMFVNTLAMRGYPAENKSFTEFLLEIKEHALNAYDNMEYPFEDLVEQVEVRRDISRSPLFDVMFIKQDNENVKLSMGDTELRVLDIDPNIAKFDLTLQVRDFEGGYRLDLEFCSDLFIESTAVLILEHFIELVDSIIANPEGLISEFEMISEAEREKILTGFNDTYAEYPRDKTVTDLFEEQAEKTPANTALKLEDETMTYSELNAKANMLAYRLRELGIKPNDHVALMAERSIEMIVGILGTIKAGSAYVPIDLKYPEERIKYMLEDSAPKVVLTYGANAQEGIDIPMLDLGKESSYDDKEENLSGVNKPSDLVYILYTSGTTGKPKGVMIEHRGFVNLRKRLERLNPCEQDIILQFASLSFDASTYEIALSLLFGGALSIIPKKVIQDTRAFDKYVDEHDVTMALLPPSYFTQVNPYKFRRIITGGAAANREAVEYANKLGIEYTNEYGPTEATVTASNWDYDNRNPIPVIIPIGRPIENTQIYIMSGNMLCGIGIPGELCVVGAGLARGYLNMPELTAEKFIENPFGEGKLYRTGDLARWLPNGNIEYLGRIDDQVKIRGYRIELGEIESLLRKQTGVANAAVVARKFGEDKSICAYLVAGTDPLNMDKIRDALRKELPEYMIPAFMMQIEALPLNRNGKLDKKALPEPDALSGQEYVPPQNDIEQTIINVFEEILVISPIGITNNFFELGGDSIKAIMVVSELRKKGYELAVADLMRHQTVRQLCQNIFNIGVKAIDSVMPVRDGNQDACSSADILMHLEYYGDNYLKSKGVSDSRRLAIHESIWQNENIIYEIIKIDSDATSVSLALKNIISKQGVLRAKYNHETGCLEEYFYSDEWEVPIANCGFGLTNAEFGKIVSEIDYLGSGKLLSRLLILRTSEKDCILLCVINHMIWDLSSQDMFRTMINEALVNKLHAKEYSYIDYCRKLEDQVKMNRLKITSDQETEVDKYIETALKAFMLNTRKDAESITEIRAKLNEMQIHRFSENPVETGTELLFGLLYNDLAEEMLSVPFSVLNFNRNELNKGMLGITLNVDYMLYDVKNKSRRKIEGMQGKYFPDDIATTDNLKLIIEKYGLFSILGSIPNINYLGIFQKTTTANELSSGEIIVQTVPIEFAVAISMQFYVQNSVLFVRVSGMSIEEELVRRVLENI